MQVIQGRCLGINSQPMIQRGKNFLKMNRTLNRVFAESIGGADDLPGLDSASGEHRTADLGPMITPTIFFDARCSSEFPPTDHRDVVENASLL